MLHIVNYINQWKNAKQGQHQYKSECEAKQLKTVLHFVQFPIELFFIHLPTSFFVEKNILNY